MEFQPETILWIHREEWRDDSRDRLQGIDNMLVFAKPGRQKTRTYSEILGIWV